MKAFFTALNVYENPPAPIYGCTDPAADNYNPLATVDNGSCTYLLTPPTNIQAEELLTDVSGNLDFTLPFILY